VKRAFRKVRRRRDSTLFYILYPFICCFCCGCCLTPLAIARRGRPPKPPPPPPPDVERPPPPVVAPVVVERPAAVEAPAADDTADVADLRDGRRPSTPPRAIKAREKHALLEDVDDVLADFRKQMTAVDALAPTYAVAKWRWADEDANPRSPMRLFGRHRRGGAVSPGAAAFATPASPI
jgi:hypothetical protein